MRLSLYCKTKALMALPPQETAVQREQRLAVEGAYRDAYQRAFIVETDLVLKAERHPLTAEDVRRILDGAA